MKIEKKIEKTYLDFNATTPLASELLERLPEALTVWGNPSSIHWAGQHTKTLLREARAAAAQALGVSPLEIIYTSGGSEANNTVLQSFFEKTRGLERNEFITSAIEHPSILKTLAQLQEQGAIVHFISVNRQGELDLEHFKKVLSQKTALVTMMLANNETGLILPIQKVTEMAHAFGAKMHTDAVQAFGKIPLNLNDLGVDFASFSGHKFYALKGSGILFCKKGNELRPLIFGGGQERHRRGGTENTLGIWALGQMSLRAPEIAEKCEKVRRLRNHFEALVKEQIHSVQITHENSLRLPNTSSLVIDGVDGETMLMSLDVKGYAVSTGAACSSGSPEPSPVLLTMGLSKEEAQSSLRVSLGWTTTEQEIEGFIDSLKAVIIRLRSISGQTKAQYLAGGVKV